MRKLFYRAILTFALIVSSQSIIAKETIEISPVNEKLTEIQVSKSLASMPLTFTANMGQWDEKVKFRANAGGATMWFAPDGAYYQFTRTIKSEDVDDLGNVTLNRLQPVSLSKGHQPDAIETMMIKANYVGSNPQPVIRGLEEIDYKCNYFIGNDKSKWATDVPNYTAVMYEQVYDGIDLKYYGNGTHMEYDFIVEPGADFSQIKIQYEGAENIDVNANGELVVTTIWGEVVEQRPVIYQVQDGSRIPIEGKYLLQPDNSFSFELADYDPTIELVIDPVLEYSTYLGGSGAEQGLGIAVDASGSAYIIGSTSSQNFPRVIPSNGVFQSGIDVFVTKINSIGETLIYSTFLGSSSNEGGTAIAVDSSGIVCITGYTNNSDFPTTQNAFDQSYNGGVDAFVTKLNLSGGLIYSTYLGGTLDENNGSFYNGGFKKGCIALDYNGNAYIAGTTASSDFPRVNNSQDSLSGGTDVYISKLNSDGSILIYSSHLGGTLDDYGIGIAVDAFGSAYLTGVTESMDFPTTSGVFQESLNGGMFMDTQGAFVTKINDIGAIVYSTYLGGNKANVNDRGNSIAVDVNGSAYITGSTNNSEFPITQNSYDSTDYFINSFVTKLNKDGNKLEYSTYLDGASAHSIVVNEFGQAIISGVSAIIGLPVIDAIQPLHAGAPMDAFVSMFGSNGENLLFSSHLGGSDVEIGYGVAIDNLGNVFITGRTNSIDFNIHNAYQPDNNGGSDAFITKILFDIPTDIVEYDLDILPTNFVLSQNYPNPFNPSTTIEFNLPTKSDVTINIYNLLGQQINQLVNQEYSAGNYKVTWDGTTSNGTQVSTGIYFYRIETDGIVETKKMVLLK